MNLATDETMRELNDCGCCEGTSAETPVEVNNRPGLSAIAYRVGTQARILESMLAALSDAARPSLGKLKTRDTEDFSIALLDAWATVEDVLTFYQERIANESYLRTATERRSVTELVRALGYELQPGVAASTALAFTLETAAGAPGKVTIPVGTKVQSIPGPNEKPQTFETVEELDARAAWNLLEPQTVEPQRIRSGDMHIFLKGMATNLKPGDALIFVGPDRQSNANSTQWNLSRVKTVEANQKTGRTLVTWDGTLNNVMGGDGLSVIGLKIYVLRQRANIFGYNAPDWRTMTTEIQQHYRPDDFDSNSVKEWLNFNSLITTMPDQIDLDTVYQKITKDSWLVLTLPDGPQELYSVAKAIEAARADFTLSGKTTRITLSKALLAAFNDNVRATTVFAESEELELAEVPITDPVWKKLIPLDAKVEGLEPGKKLIVTGKRLRADIGLAMQTFAGATFATFRSGSVTNLSTDFFVTGPPVLIDSINEKWHFQNERGIDSYLVLTQDQRVFWQEAVTLLPGKIVLLPSKETDAVVSELVTLDGFAGTDPNRTTLKLKSDLQNVYDAATVSIYANITAATHGETTSEVLGSGDASQPFQALKLRQSPLTYTSADTPSGTASTLEVQVNDLRWSEVASLYGQGPKDRVYMTQLDDAGVTTVEFGDGVTGARLPTGTANVKATYRKGIGLEGDVRASQLALLMTRPLGVKSVTNPLAASGAADPQETKDAQQNAPLTILTLDRIVSLRDYEDFARAYAGISKALATWTWKVHSRGVLVTIAGSLGAVVGESSQLFTNLMSAMRKAGDSNVPLQLISYSPKTFRLAAEVKVREEYDIEVVRAQIDSALRREFSFAARSFGQSVALSEVIEVIQSIAGVVFVNVRKLYRADKNESLETVLAARLPEHSAGTAVTGAELLTLDAAVLDELEVSR
jgi:hypothetical protein